ncbi:hypothetical protein VM94_03640 [Janthinobacterium sp. KBS0711]|nr:hypothetical protein VM94_03640 [Janthinobacterium sp. KBS0711]
MSSRWLVGSATSSCRLRCGSHSENNRQRWPAMLVHDRPSGALRDRAMSDAASLRYSTRCCASRTLNSKYWCGFGWPRRGTSMGPVKPCWRASFSTSDSSRWPVSISDWSNNSWLSRRASTYTMAALPTHRARVRPSSTASRVRRKDQVFTPPPAVKNLLRTSAQDPERHIFWVAMTEIVNDSYCINDSH